jgi:hypothetical protein
MDKCIHLENALKPGRKKLEEGNESLKQKENITQIFFGEYVKVYS